MIVKVKTGLTVHNEVTICSDMTTKNCCSTLTLLHKSSLELVTLNDSLTLMTAFSSCIKVCANANAFSKKIMSLFPIA